MAGLGLGDCVESTKNREIPTGYLRWCQDEEEDRNVEMHVDNTGTA